MHLGDALMGSSDPRPPVSLDVARFSAERRAPPRSRLASADLVTHRPHGLATSMIVSPCPM